MSEALGRYNRRQRSFGNEIRDINQIPVIFPDRARIICEKREASEDADQSWNTVSMVNPRGFCVGVFVFEVLMRCSVDKGNNTVALKRKRTL